jgi:hypothetical protein
MGRRAQEPAARSGVMNAEETYRAVQAIKPGNLELTRKPLRNPDSGQVRIRAAHGRSGPDLRPGGGRGSNGGLP